MKRVAVAGLSVRLDAADPELGALAPELERFPALPGADDLVLRADWADLSREVGPVRFDSKGVWRLYERGGVPHYAFSFTSGGAPYKIARVDAAARTGRIFMDRAALAGEAPYPLEYPLDELIFAELLARAGGALIHACGVRRAGGGGDLCAAHSGGGKSTLARLVHASGVLEVLSDEHVAARVESDGVRLFGTPWSGDAGLSSNASARLERILFLAHAPEDRLVPLPPALAAARLYACSYPPAHEAGLAAANLEACARIAEAAPAFELGFRPTPDVVRLLERV